MKIKKLEIALSPCYPSHGIIVTMENGWELWDCDCASGSEEVTLSLAKEQYTRRKVIMWNDPRHYSHRKKPC